MDRRLQIERWFSARGVPQLIAGYSTEQSMDARAVPFIGVWIVAGVVLWGRRPSAGVIENALVLVVALAVIGALLGGWLAVRGRPPFRARVRLDVLDIAVIGLVPGSVVALIHGDPWSVIGVSGAILLGVGVIYLMIGFGLIEIALWALGLLPAQLGQIATLVSRTLPVLLILVVFLLFASELWQAAHTLGGLDLAAIVGLLLLVATILVVTSARAEIRLLEASHDPARSVELLTGTPAAGLAVTAAPPPRLAWLERLNLVILMLVSQLVQSIFVGLLVMLFLVALGLLAIPASVQETWVGEPVRTVIGFELLGEPRMLSSELLLSTALLGGMCALYFTGLALTDASFRTEFHARVVGEVEQIIAVRAAYLASAEVGGG